MLEWIQNLKEEMIPGEAALLCVPDASDSQQMIGGGQ